MKCEFKVGDKVVLDMKKTINMEDFPGLLKIGEIYTIIAIDLDSGGQFPMIFFSSTGYKDFGWYSKRFKLYKETVLYGGLEYE